MTIEALPEEIKVDLDLVKKIILEAGAKEIYLFGSLVEGRFRKDSDLDIAVRGLGKDKFFKVYGELLTLIKRDIDIVGLDYKSDFSEQLKKTGSLLRVA